ncbi:MAG: hypothetical protein VB996_02030 [Pseudomonadales bacterium]
MAQDWKGTAYNQVPHSRNEIHGDKVAKHFGFKGGLVPGVTVSAYLLHPAAVSYGMDFLERGFAHVRVNSPLYDEQAFEIHIENQIGRQTRTRHQEQGDQGYSAVLVPNGEAPCATAEIHLAGTKTDPPVWREDELGDQNAASVPATRENMEALRESGCKAFTYRWNADHEMSTYLRERSGMATPYSMDEYANPSFVLGISNWVLAANAYMNPWVHMETKSQNYAPIPQGTKVVGEMEIKDLFDKKGHEFVDVLVNIFDVESNSCFSSIELRAIYKLRGL